jgi:hypothetical protein
LTTFNNLLRFALQLRNLIRPLFPNCHSKEPQNFFNYIILGWRDCWNGRAPASKVWGLEFKLQLPTCCNPLKRMVSKYKLYNPSHLYLVSIICTSN